MEMSRMNAPKRCVAFLVLCFSVPCSQEPKSTPAAQPATQAPAGADTVPGSPVAEEHLSNVVAEVNGRPLYRAFYEQSLNFIRTRLPAGQDNTTLERYLNAK